MPITRPLYSFIRSTENIRRKNKQKLLCEEPSIIYCSCFAKEVKAMNASKIKYQ